MPFVTHQGAWTRYDYSEAVEVQECTKESMLHQVKVSLEPCTAGYTLVHTGDTVVIKVWTPSGAEEIYECRVVARHVKHAKKGKK